MVGKTRFGETTTAPLLSGKQINARKWGRTLGYVPIFLRYLFFISNLFLLKTFLHFLVNENQPDAME